MLGAAGYMKEHMTELYYRDARQLTIVEGTSQVQLGLNSMRPIVAARGIGLAEGALMYAVDYVKQRAAFNKTIADMQGIQWKIAELATEI